MPWIKNDSPIILSSTIVRGSTLQKPGDGRLTVSLSDLILVNGCGKTSEWACAAWSEKTQSVRLSFVTGAPGISEGSPGLWRRWVSSQSLDKNVEPRPLLAPAISASGTSPQITMSESTVNRTTITSGFRVKRSPNGFSSSRIISR